MATTTPNFGWPVPTSTDLVKDGAVAIEGLGDAIDASLLDLKGGTTGQVLAKASNTDMDFSWVAQDDSNAIQNAIVDAKGDIIAATANDTPARLAVGTNGQVLTADSAETTGLKWATPASGGSTFAGCQLTGITGGQTISNNTDTALSFNVEVFDTDAYHDNSTNNSRITIPSGKAGYYQIGGLVDFDNSAVGSRLLNIKKNNVSYKTFYATASTTYPSGIIESIIYLSVGDYVELFVTQNSGTSQTVYADAVNGQFYAYFIGA
jgi:hypothetical protein